VAPRPHPGPRPLPLPKPTGHSRVVRLNKVSLPVLVSSGARACYRVVHARRVLSLGWLLGLLCVLLCAAVMLLMNAGDGVCTYCVCAGYTRRAAWSLPAAYPALDYPCADVLVSSRVENARRAPLLLLPFACCVCRAAATCYYALPCCVFEYRAARTAKERETPPPVLACSYPASLSLSLSLALFCALLRSFPHTTYTSQMRKN